MNLKDTSKIGDAKRKFSGDKWTVVFEKGYTQIKFKIKIKINKRLMSKNIIVWKKNKRRISWELETGNQAWDLRSGIYGQYCTITKNKLQESYDINKELNIEVLLVHMAVMAPRTRWIGRSGENLGPERSAGLDTQGDAHEKAMMIGNLSTKHAYTKVTWCDKMRWDESGRIGVCASAHSIVILPHPQVSEDGKYQGEQFQVECTQKLLERLVPPSSYNAIVEGNGGGGHGDRQR